MSRSPHQLGHAPHGRSRLIAAAVSFRSTRLRFTITLITLVVFAAFVVVSFARRSSAQVGLTDHEASLSQKAGEVLKPQPGYVPGEILVRFRQNAPAAKTGTQVELAVVGQAEIPVRVEQLAGPELVQGLRFARVAPADTERALEALRKRSDVIYAEPNYIRRKSSTPNDSSFPEMWNLKNTGQSGGTAGADINAEQAWNTTTGSRNVVVAVLDEGIDVNHQDLQANIWRNLGETPGNGIDDDGNGYADDVNGYDFLHNDATVYDGPGQNPDGSAIDAHGTHVAGTIGASGNNGLGVVGINWQVSLMSLKFLGPDGGTSADLLKALAYAKMMRDRWISSGGTQGANIRVTNNSYGGDNYSQSEFDAIQALGSSGILFVAAAGNEGQNNQVVPGYPASYDLPGVISVAATDRNDNVPSFSNRGSLSVHLGAPGLSVLSTTPGNTYSVSSGTSMASPHVAGTAALVLAVHPEFSLERLRSAVIFSGDPVNSLSQTTITGNRLSAAGALQNAAEVDTIAPAAISNLQVAFQEGRHVSLHWTAAGDDGNSGRASLYEFRFTDQAEGSKYLVGTKRPGSAGEQELLDVTLPYRHVSGALTLTVYDNAGNNSTATINIAVNPNDADPYVVTQGPSAALSTGGGALNANFDDALINYSLPFNFPFFERFASEIRISTNGVIYFSPSFPGDYDLLNAASRLSSFHMIAGLWDDLDLRTSARADAGIYVVQPNSDRIIFRWQGVPCNPNLALRQCTGGGPVNFEVELNSDGTIVTRYGDGNTGLHPVVGLGGSEPDAYPIASHTSEIDSRDLPNAPIITYQRRTPPKKADLRMEIKSYPNPVMVGGNINYALIVFNDGPDTAASVKVVDTLSIVAQFVSCSTPTGSCSGPAPGKSGQVFANLGPLASGSSTTLTIVATAPILQSSYSNNAVVSSLTYDPNSFNNAASQDTVVYRPNPNPLTQAISMAAGGGSYLALKTDGSVLAWGDNTSGQLGDGTNNTPNSTTTSWVKGLASVKSVGAGNSHSLAVKPNGNLWAWGGNYTGQLGDGSTTNRSLPAPVNGIANVKEATGGLGHTIAVTNTGTVWTWGDNSSGQIGDGTNTNRLTPTQVNGITGVIAVAAGFNHSAALRSDGTVWTWGDNSRGQLGNGTHTVNPIPGQIGGLTGIVAIAADGYFTLALRNDGTVWSWGSNNFGQLGDGTTTDRNAPVQVSGLANVTAITSGVTHGLALRGDGTIWAWGDNGFGRLGIGLSYSTYFSQTRPLPVIILTNAIAILMANGRH